MATRTQIVALVYIYLSLSMDPINAFRVKNAVGQAASKMAASQELIKEMQKVVEEHQGTASAKSSSDYIGETWATCPERKKDFERRSMKVDQRYEEAKTDGKVSLSEAGWVLLKAYSLVQTFVTAEKQGCSWVEGEEIDKTALKDLIGDTKQYMPCYDAAMAALDSHPDKDKETDKAVLSSLSILMSEDCKVPTSSNIHEPNEEDMAQAVAYEETEEDKALEASKKLQEALEKAPELNPDAVSSFIQSTEAFTRSLQLKQGDTRALNISSGDGYWRYCSEEHGVCHCPTDATCLVRYGGDGKFSPAKQVSGQVSCKKNQFGDFAGSTSTNNCQVWVDQSGGIVHTLMSFIGYIIFVLFIMFSAVVGASAILVAGFMMCIIVFVFTVFLSIASGGASSPASGALFSGCVTLLGSR